MSYAKEQRRMGTQSPYRITKYSLDQAKKLGVELRQSSDPKKKIDVYKDNKKVASIGASGYSDYPTWTKAKGSAFAKEKRRLYRLRHKGEEKVLGSNGYYAWNILW
jgi:hypothetical protein